MRPWFLTFEGLDGSGKSTHLARLASWLATRGVAHRVTHEPGGTPIAQRIREVFLDREHGAMDPIAELLLVFAARRQNLIEVIEPALAAGEHVLCDRWSDSTRAYQGFGRGVSQETIDVIDRLATGGRRPDRTLLFDLPPAVARKRGQSGRRRATRGVDRLDAESLAFYERVRDGYLDLARREPDRFRVIDSSGDAVATETAVRRALADLLETRWRPRGLERALGLARGARLYPSVILHGGGEATRRAAAIDLARALLCDAEAAARPCGRCRHCTRIVWPGDEVERFHPDVQILERDLKTSTSVEATRSFLRAAQVLPFEARGQVFVVASAETLSGEASDALLKAIEEPGLGSPRHFLLLAPSRLDLAATLRSRSLSVFLGAGEGLDPEELEPLAADLATSLVAYWKQGGGIHLVAAAQRLARIGGFEDPRAARPWTLAAAAAREVALREIPPSARRALLALAEDLLVSSSLRLRGISAERIFEGLVARHLAPTKGVAARAGG